MDSAYRSVIGGFISLLVELFLDKKVQFMLCLRTYSMVLYIRIAIKRFSSKVEDGVVNEIASLLNNEFI